MVDMARAKPLKSLPHNDLQHIPHIPHGIYGIYGTSHTPFMHKSCIKGLKYKNTSYIYIWVSERGAINTTEATWDMWCGRKALWGIHLQGFGEEGHKWDKWYMWYGGKASNGGPNRLSARGATTYGIGGTFGFSSGP